LPSPFSLDFQAFFFSLVIAKTTRMTATTPSQIIVALFKDLTPLARYVMKLTYM
jgi:hypothetical protein